MSGQETQTQMFSCGVCEIFKNWSLRTTDSETCCFTWSVLLYKLYLWLKLVLGPANIRLDEDVLKMSFVFVFRRRLKPSSRRLDQDKYVCVSLTSSEDVLVKTNIFVLVICLQDVIKTSCQDVFKTFSRRLAKTSSRHLQDVFKTSCKDIFKTFSRRIIRLNCLPRSHFWVIYGQCRKFESVIKISQVLA